MKNKKISNIPHSKAMKEYLKNFDKLGYFEYLISEGSQEYIKRNSSFLETFEIETNTDRELLKFAQGAKAKSKFLMHFLRQQFFIFHVHLFEYFLLNIIKEIFRANTETLRGSNKQISIAEIQAAIDKDKLTDLLIDTEMKDFGKGSYETISKYLKTRFKIDLSASKIKDEKISEIFQMRHIIVHNNGIIDKEFKNKIKDKKYVEGKKVYIGQTVLDRTRRSFMKIARYIDSKYYDKYGLCLTLP